MAVSIPKPGIRGDDRRPDCARNVRLHCREERPLLASLGCSTPAGSDCLWLHETAPAEHQPVRLCDRDADLVLPDRNSHRGRNSSLPPSDDPQLLTVLLAPFADHAEMVAGQLIARFGSMFRVLDASPELLGQHLSRDAVLHLAAVRAAMLSALLVRADERPIIEANSDVIEYFQAKMAHAANEQARVLFLNGANRLLSDWLASDGDVDTTFISPRRIIHRALDLGASAIIIAHNHPSGDPRPSRADIEATKAIARAAKAVDLMVLDHVIVSGCGHYSFSAAGLL